MICKKGLYLGTKHRRAHVYFSNQKIKVKLAVPTMSKSIAVDIDFGRNIFEIPDFTENITTSKFLRYFNTTFDILVFNCRCSNAFDFKKALCTTNFNDIVDHADKMVGYIQAIELPDTHEKLCSHRRKAGFLGVVAILRNIKFDYQRYVCTALLKKILFYMTCFLK